MMENNQLTNNYRVLNRVRRAADLSAEKILLSDRRAAQAVLWFA